MAGVSGMIPTQAAGQEVFTLTGHSGSVGAVSVTPDGTGAISASDDQICKVISTSADHTCRAWDLVSVEEVATFSPDGRTMVIGESSGRVHFLRLEEEVE